MHHTNPPFDCGLFTTSRAANFGIKGCGCTCTFTCEENLTVNKAKLTIQPVKGPFSPANEENETNNELFRYYLGP